MVDGCPRFKANPIVRYLLDSHPTVDMNAIAIREFSDEDQWQFAQLIGYSVSGGGSLSYADSEHVAEADRDVDALLKVDDERRQSRLQQHSAILLQLIDRGLTDAPGIETATEEMIADGVVPRGWTIYDVKALPKDTP
jgi:hypothetical protein